ncbi:MULTISPECIES: serine hydrolase domain-containing protein [unclassified Schlesneria]|uniref:serine hydrolase domain-containing protein n=1 Tax=unclassified Schlesneria TaxID=2762017 RepID=UPI002EEF6844
MTKSLRTIHPQRWQSVADLADHWCKTNVLPCLSVATGTTSVISGRFHKGRFHEHTAPAFKADPIFLIASITKPVVATAALLLIERGQLTLADRVTDYIPEFGRNSKHGVELRHLLTHTSGLPDMLPDNQELRQAHASLQRFVERTCEEPLAFSPGRGVLYQSMGFAVLGEIIARVSGKSCAQFIQEELFQPIGMQDSALGAPDEWYEGQSANMLRVTPCVVPESQASGTEWNWNSRYWRQLGAPWGGMLTTAKDLSLFAQFLLRRGITRSGERLLSPAAIDAATRNQLQSMRDVPDEERRCRPWGLGWRLNWPAHSANFGDLLGPRTFGHWGATGTVLWIDPDAEIFALILTTLPQEPSGKYLSRLSNTIAAAWQ